MIHQTDSNSLIENLSHLSSGKKRGKLKIYFGYAAGVGKTCAMLNDAHDAKANGIDVVAGYIEAHVRTETLALIEGLETLATLEVPYKGIILKEFDLDMALQRNPELILVDELAHTNAVGCRHKKRYQDVEELLQAGIDVYTTINVQHIESLNDIVESITNINVKERIPDSAFDMADQIELVDLELDNLIERLNKGKVYPEEQVERALKNFFVKEKLIALREIALRRTADQVNRIAVQNESSKNGIFYTNEHILVCLSSSFSNAKVIRTASRMSDAFHGSFTALYVETQDTRLLGEKYKSDLEKNLRLAEQLGAQIANVYGDDIPAQIAEYAKVSRVSKIVIGRSSQHKSLFKPNYIDKLIELAPTIDVYVIPDMQTSLKINEFKLQKPSNLSIADTVRSIGLLLICTMIGFLFDYLNFNVENIIIIYILGILINAIVTKGRMYSAISSILSVLIFNLFFTEPHYSLKAYDPGYPVTFVVMLSASLITSTLTKQIKEQVHQSSEKAYRTEVLLETSRKLQLAKNKEDILSETANQMVKLLDRTITFYSSDGNSLDQPVVFSSKDSLGDPREYIGREEQAVAQWVFKNNKRAGATTNTLSGVKCLYLAVRGRGTVLAVAGIAMDKDAALETFEKGLLIAMLGECSLALEKEVYNETQKQTSMKMQQEQLRGNLLRAISHDLRTPLTSISGNAGILIGNSQVLNEDQKQNLYTNIYDDSLWLINLVENLLSITRIDNGRLNLSMEAELLEEVITEALMHINRNSVNYIIKTTISDSLLMAKMDSRLIIQVIINIVDNAIKYTEPGSHINISVIKEEQYICLEIADNGTGISDQAKTKLFDMFYTADNILGDGRRGLGLGLYLCKSIINAHGGNIYVKDNIPYGTIFGFTLQSEEMNLHE